MTFGTKKSLENHNFRQHKQARIWMLCWNVLHPSRTVTFQRPEDLELLEHWKKQNLPILFIFDIYSVTKVQDELVFENHSNWQLKKSNISESQFNSGSEQLYPNIYFSNLSGTVNIERPEEFNQFIARNVSGSYDCSICHSFSHRSVTTVRNHVESRHFPNSFSYSCTQCEMTFGTKTNLENHKRRQHKVPHV